MHTISHSRGADSLLIRSALVVWSIGELAVALALHGLLMLMVWQERARDRRRLASLTDYELRDIGLSHSQIDRETRKPFWQA